MFTYCPAEAIEAAEAGRIPLVFVDVAPHDQFDCVLIAAVGSY